MGPILFGYVFRDLLKVFTLSAFAVAGIMSFGGLLRPLRSRGLEPVQAMEMLAWLLPAMMTYSLPVAALFATTFVYGRMSADNEATAMRAAGIPLGVTGVALPAVVLGLLACGLSLVLLCFIVPAANLRVERAIYTNLARLVANEVNQTKRVIFRGLEGADAGLTVTADRADVLDLTGTDLDPDTQAVRLDNVFVLRYVNVGTRTDRYDVPDEVYTATRATAFIRPPAYLTGRPSPPDASRDDRFLLTVVLDDGLKFPRVFEHRTDSPLVAAVHESQFGPVAMASPVRENTKFLDIRELHVLLNDPGQSRRVGELLATFVERDQRQQFLARLRNDATVDDGGSGAVLAADTGLFVLSTRGVSGLLDDRSLGLVADDAPDAGITLVQRRGAERLVVTAPRAVVRADPVVLASGPALAVSFTFADATVEITGDDTASAVTEGRAFERRLVVPMPPAVAAVADASPQEYLERTTLTPADAAVLRSALRGQHNGILGEIHARLSFAVACLVLPWVGASLGMLFRSGNFLTSFALSVVPAMVSVVMIVVGQQHARSVPLLLAVDARDPLVTGLVVIWGGNLVVAAVATALLWRVGRGVTV